MQELLNILANDSRINQDALATSFEKHFASASLIVGAGLGHDELKDLVEKCEVSENGILNYVQAVKMIEEREYQNTGFRR